MIVYKNIVLISNVFLKHDIYSNIDYLDLFLFLFLLLQKLIKIEEINYSK
jgi:hypothetical protein